MLRVSFSRDADIIMNTLWVFRLSCNYVSEVHTDLVVLLRVGVARCTVTHSTVGWGCTRSLPIKLA